MKSEQTGRGSSPRPVGDLILAGLVGLLALAVIGSALRMPRPEGWAEAPGLFPLICGVALLGMALVLALAAPRRSPAEEGETVGEPEMGGEPETVGEPETGGGADADRPELGRTLLVGGSVLVYVLVLIPLLHYTLATFVYLLAVIWYFWRGKLLWIFVISLATSIFLSQTFQHAFSIILP